MKCYELKVGRTILQGYNSSEQGESGSGGGQIDP